MTLRLGIERPDRPPAVVADAEARVITHELERRLGDVVIDFRIDGPAIGPWLPRDQAAWPAAIDHPVDTATLWNSDTPPLAGIFGRTVGADAADVRRRMLAHLGVLTTGDVPEPARPTDAWLVCQATDGRLFPEFTPHDASSERLDELFDAITSGLAVDTMPTIERLTTQRDAARRDAQRATDELLRIEVEMADRLDALQAEIDVLRERLERRTGSHADHA